MTLKMLPASWYLKYLFKGFRSFNTVNMGSVGQRASKLLAVKVGGLKKKSAIWPRPLSNQSAGSRLRSGSNLSQSLTDSNFAALWPTDPIFTASIDLNPFKKCAKSQCCALCFQFQIFCLYNLGCIWPRPLANQSARVRLCLGSNLSQSLTDSNFVALWPTDPIFTASKDLNL